MSTRVTPCRWFPVVLLIAAACGGSDTGRGQTRSPGGSEAAAARSSPPRGPSSKVAPNRFGLSRTLMGNGDPLEQPDHPFFQSLGVNGRSCSSCHLPEAGMSITPDLVRDRFQKTNGLDPLFRTVDGSSSPVADVSTLEARRKAFSLLLDRALIRVGLPIHLNAEFELAAVDDPYGFASARELSLSGARCHPPTSAS